MEPLWKVCSMLKIGHFMLTPLMAMPLGAGFLSWVVAWHTIERKNESLFQTIPPHVPTLYLLNLGTVPTSSSLLI